MIDDKIIFSEGVFYGVIARYYDPAVSPAL